MYIYVILLIAILLYGLLLNINPNDNNIKKLFLFLSFTSCALVLGLRNYTVGEDTGQYIIMFKENIPLNIILTSPGFKVPYLVDQWGGTQSVESGFLLWCKFVHLFSNNAQVFIFLTAALTCFLFAKFIYDNCKDDVFFATMVFLCESSFMVSFNLAREMLACGVALQAYTLIEKRKNWQAIVVILLAYAIHNSAIVAFLWLPILLSRPKNKRLNFSFMASIAVLLPILSIVMQNTVTKLFSDYSLYYTKNYYQNSLGIGSTILMIIEIVCIIYMYRDNFKIHNSEKISLMVLVYIGFQIAGLKVVMLSRIATYFRAYLILFFNDFLEDVNPHFRSLCKVALLVLLIMFYFSFASTDSRTYSFFWS